MMHDENWLRYLQLIEQRPEDFRDTGSIHIVTDPAVVEDYRKKTDTVIGVCWESPFYILVTDLVWEREGEYFPYMRLLATQPQGAVVCIPVCGEKLVLLRQYRHAMRDYQYAFPRGFGEAGLSGEENAHKELMEELGAKAQQTVYLGSVIADSGISGAGAEVWLCRITDYEPHTGYEGIADVIVVDADQIHEMIRRGQINDGFTLSAWSLYRSRG